jgi:hypothetical protein
MGVNDFTVYDYIRHFDEDGFLWHVKRKAQKEVIQSEL